MLEKFNTSGLGKEAASWVSTGENLPVSGAQISQVLGQGTLGELAAKFGLDCDHVSSGLAQMLPHLIDKATPNGTHEGADTLLSQAMPLLGGLFGAVPK